MSETGIPAHDLSSGHAEDIKALGIFEQFQYSSSSEIITGIQPTTVSELRQWYAKAIRDAISDDEPEEFATLKMAIGILPEWREGQKPEWDCTGHMITSLEAGDWHTMGALCEFNTLPAYRRTRFKTSDGPLECLKYFVMYYGTFNLLWIYIPTRRTTIAVLRCISEEGKKEVLNMLESLKSTRSLSLTHPLHLGLIAHHQITQQLQAMIRRHQKSIIEAQFLTGFHDYTNIERTKADLKNMDVSEASFNLVSSAITLGTAEEGCKGAIDLARFFIEQNDHFTRLSRRAGIPVDESLQDEIDQTAKCCLRRAEAASNKSLLWQKKASVVMQGLFNLIAQRDQNVSIAIAEATKRDSTSMKSIAAVTMIFLPGTFTASIFAMPWFANNKGKYLNDLGHFWLFWIVTIPLTIVTLICWAMWIKYTRRIERLKEGVVAGGQEQPSAKKKLIEVMRLFSKMKNMEEAGGGRGDAEVDARDDEKMRRYILPFYAERAKQSGAAGDQEEKMMMVDELH